jgi:hypothetical protein
MRDAGQRKGYRRLEREKGIDVAGACPASRVVVGCQEPLFLYYIIGLTTCSRAFPLVWGSLPRLSLVPYSMLPSRE